MYDDYVALDEEVLEESSLEIRVEALMASRAVKTVKTLQVLSSDVEGEEGSKCTTDYLKKN